MAQQTNLYARKATLDDIKHIDDIYYVVNTAFQARSDVLARKERITKAQLEKIIKADDQHLILAFDRTCHPEKLVGVVSLAPKAGMAKTAIAGMMSVHPNYRGQGVAFLIVRQTVRTIHEEGYVKGWVTVHESMKKFIAFYKKLGFRETGDRIPYNKECVPTADRQTETSDLVVLECEVALYSDSAYAKTLASLAGKRIDSLEAHGEFLAQQDRSSKM